MVCPTIITHHPNTLDAYMKPMAKLIWHFLDVTGDPVVKKCHFPILAVCSCQRGKYSSIRETQTCSKLPSQSSAKLQFANCNSKTLKWCVSEPLTYPNIQQMLYKGTILA